jgi:hypothetical protein
LSRQGVQQLLGPASWQSSSSSLLIVQHLLGSVKTHSYPTLPTHQTRPPVIVTISKDEIWALGVMFWLSWRDPDQLAGCDEDTDMKWLPVVLLIMEIPFSSLYQCKREQLRRGWRQIEISASS